MTLVGKKTIVPEQRGGPSGAGRRSGPELVLPADETAIEWASFQTELLRLAAHAIDTHTREGDGHCRRCDDLWPCEFARQAEYLLGAL